MSETDDIATYEDDKDLSDDSGIFPTPEDRTRIMNLLASLGATRIEITFSGGGDSGEVDSATLLDAIGNELPMPDMKVQGWEKTKVWEKGGCTVTIEPKVMTINELLIQMTYDALEETSLDWYNNEGGAGEMIIDFRESPPRLELEVGINYTETSDHSFKF